LLIVDSQVHIWGAETAERPWPPPAHGLRPAPHRAVPISAESLLADMAAAGVDQAILIPPSWEGDRNDLVLDAVRRFPDRFRFIGRLDARSPSAPEWIANWRQTPGMLGLQLTFQAPMFQQPLLAGELDWLWAEVERAALPLTIYIPNRLLPIIARVLERHPGLKIILNHFGLTGHERDEEAFADFDQLLALSRFPNVAVKASCLPLYTTQSYPFPLLHGYIQLAFEAFGAQRLFWGTDLSRLPCPYRQGVTLFTEQLPWLAGTDLEWVMGRGIREWLKWTEGAA
jgi:L-fuconolactonase